MPSLPIGPMRTLVERRVGWIPNCEDAVPPPPTVVLCCTTHCARRTRCARIAFVALNVSPEPYELFRAFRTLSVSYNVFINSSPTPRTFHVSLVTYDVSVDKGIYALRRQKTPLTTGRVQEAKSHCRKIGEAWLKLGWKSTPWVQWTVATCGAALRKYCNLYVLSSVPAEHGHQPSKLAVKNSMLGRCLLRPHISRLGLPHVLNMETVDLGHDTERPGKGLPLARPQGTDEKGTTCTPEKLDLNPVDPFGALLAKCLGVETPL